MKLNKIGLMLVSLSSVFLMPSCKQASILTYDQAKAWVSKNCVEGEPTPTKGYRYFDFSKTFGNDARSLIKGLIERRYADVTLDENLIFKKDLTTSGELKPTKNLNLDILAVVSTGGNATFNVLNNTLTVTSVFDLADISDFKGKVCASTQFNKKGNFTLFQREYCYIQTSSLSERSAVIGIHKVTYNY